jgi:squalene-associated FAD-dependent desaturase
VADNLLSPPHAIVGGGLAGLSAAIALVDRGQPVHLYERRGFLGGKAYSFHDAKLDGEIDNGQHVFLRCCTAYLGLLDKLGVRDRVFLQPRLRLPLVDWNGRTAWLARRDLPAPYHLLPAFLRYAHLGAREKWAALRALVALRDTDRRRRPDLDEQTFYAWLRAHGQSERAINALWNPFVLPTLNEDVRGASADQAIMVFQEAFFRDCGAADLGYSRVGLSDLLYAEAAAYIRARGGRITCGRSVAEVVFENGRASGLRFAGGACTPAASVILAVPHRTALALLPARAREDPFFAPLASLDYSPIVNVHLWYDRPVLAAPMVGFLDSPAQWVFDRTRIGGQAGPPHHLAVSISGAHDWVAVPKGQLADTLDAELRALLPAVRGAQLLDWRVIKEKEATFRPAPGQRRARLPARTPLSGLFLAGAWTATDWPATMEGAVRSGAVAARAVLT